MVVVLNGPNLNLVGRREPEVYGERSLEEYLEDLKEDFPPDGLVCLQSNWEGQLIDWVHEYGYRESVTGIVINPGALAHYSYALADALRSVPVPAVEVHISNIFSREGFRSQSVTAPACRAMIAGLGLEGYRVAIRSLL